MSFSLRESKAGEYGDLIFLKRKKKKENKNIYKVKKNGIIVP